MPVEMSREAEVQASGTSRHRPQTASSEDKIYVLSARCMHKSFPVLLRDGPTEQYVAYEFDTMSVCSPDINL